MNSKIKIMLVKGEYIIKIDFKDLQVPAGEYSGKVIDHISFEQVYSLSGLNNKEIPHKRENFNIEIIKRKICPSQ